MRYLFVHSVIGIKPMKEQYNTISFMCLCMDFKVKPLFKQLDNGVRERLGDARKALLVALEEPSVETVRDYSARLIQLFDVSSWVKFHDDRANCGMKYVLIEDGCPMHYPPTYGNICLEKVRMWYQLLSFPLKTEQDYDKRTASRFEGNLIQLCAENASIPDEDFSSLGTLMRDYLAYKLRHLDLSVERVSDYYIDGPGAVYDGRKPHEKGLLQEYYQTANAYYPIDTLWANPDLMLEYAQITAGKVVDWKGKPKASSTVHYPDICVIHKEIPCKLSFVPKDYKGPRMVFIHPAEIMRVQQGQRRVLQDYIAKYFDSIRLADQSFNGEAAYVSSYTRHMFTMDLSEASDRISRRLVARIFPRRHWKQLAATRAVRFVLPSGKTIKPDMFAPMGSAVCFPIQSLVFLSACVAVEARRAGLKRLLSNKEGVNFMRSVEQEYRVYGDDIVGPSDSFHDIVQGFREIGLRINVNKSFVKGFFRESCGVDAYRGVEITPLRQKVNIDTFVKMARSAPRAPKTWLHLQKMVKFRNSAFQRGYQHLVECLTSLIREFYRDIPYTRKLEYSDVALLGYNAEYLNVLRRSSFRIGPYQTLEFSTLVPQSLSKRKRVYDDRYRLNDWFFKSGAKAPVRVTDSEITNYVEGLERALHERNDDVAANLERQWMDKWERYIKYRAHLSSSWLYARESVVTRTLGDLVLRRQWISL